MSLLKSAESFVAKETFEVSQVLPLMQKFQNAFTSKEFRKAEEILPGLKLAVLQLSPPTSEDNKLKQLLLNREMLELSVLLAVEVQDGSAFDRNYLQLKTFNASNTGLALSERHFPIIGLYLLFLLSNHRIAEFHTELELIPLEFQANNQFVNFSCQLEQHYMDGFYNKVLRAAEHVPLPYYGYFMSVLANTVREKVADCCEKAYESLPVSDTTKMLFTEPSQIQKICMERGWKIEQNVIWFPHPDAGKLMEIPSKRLINESLSYAHELERII